MVAGTRAGNQWTDWCGRGGGGGVVRWVANRGGTRDRGGIQGCDATPETGRKPKNVVKRDSARKRKQIGESRKNKEKQRNNFKN